MQLHGILKHDLHKTIHRINEIKLSTLAACGDVKRNVMCCPAPHRQDPVHDEMQLLADRLAAHLTPRTRAYYEIWMRDPDTGEDQLVGGNGKHAGLGGANGDGNADHEPIYGPTYLPRKFKIGIGLPGDNCIDIYANDLGFMAICENFRIVGYNVLVGGGMGVVPSAAKSFPAVAKRMAFVRPDQVIDVATEVVKVQRDFGNRSDRKVARLKYLIHNWGLEAFKAKVEEYYGQKLPEPHPDDVHGFDDHLGWHEQGDGRWFYGLNIENGRIQDSEHADGPQLKTALREICRDVSAAHSAHWASKRALHRHLAARSQRRSRKSCGGIACRSRTRSRTSAAGRWPASPGRPAGWRSPRPSGPCRGMIDHLEVELAKLGLSSDVFTLRMTGCPNGCARPYNCDIGLVGRAAGKYTVFVGGRLLGDRLNFIYRDMVPATEVVPTLVPLFTYFKSARENGETFGDFCARKGADDLRSWTEQYAAALSATI